MRRAAQLLLAVGGALAGAIARAGPPPAIDARWELWSLDFDSPATAPRVERIEHRVAGERGQAFKSGAQAGGAQLFLSAAGRISPFRL